MMFTRAEAEERGWTFPTDDGGLVCAVAPDGRIVGRVSSVTPYFFAVEYAAREEGEPFPEKRDTATIKTVSGETYAPTPPTPELVAQQLRTEKRRRLEETDWTQLPDVQTRLTNAQKTAVINYRQAIRDATRVDGFPAVPDWATR